MSPRDERLNDIAAIAVRIEQETWMPAHLTVAQWAVESNWGAKPIGHANYFGMKRAARHTKYCEQVTHEMEKGCLVEVKAEFADYENLEASARDYAWLITHAPPYAQAWAEYKASFLQDFKDFARKVLSVYATSAYAALALEIAAQSNVCKAISVVQEQ